MNDGSLLFEKLKSSETGYDIDRIALAYQTAEQAHRGQTQRNGEPFIVHPVCVAIILADLGADTESIIAALLADTVTDSQYALQQVRRLFGEDMASLIDGIQKLSMIPAKHRDNAIQATAHDTRIILVKLADRLQYLRTISYRMRCSRALEEITQSYIPIARDLGIWSVKQELEDRSLQYLQPGVYADLVSLRRTLEAERADWLLALVYEIAERLRGYGVSGLRMESRVKSISGIYRKLYLQSRTMEELDDLYTVRILTGSVPACYEVLGHLHDAFRPIPGRFRDYIASPKDNAYQSLHSTVLHRDGAPFTVQIRTREMHRTAQCGCAAHGKHWHWHVHIPVDGGIPTPTAAVHAFTPKGDVISLPFGSTVIDFAYAIHSEVGNRMVGATIDGRLVPLTTRVHNGNTVKIITTSRADYGPRREWLESVGSASARRQIQRWLRQMDHEQRKSKEGNAQ